jgi:hypothetical protein
MATGVPAIDADRHLPARRHLLCIVYSGPSRGQANRMAPPPDVPLAAGSQT